MKLAITNNNYDMSVFFIVSMSIYFTDLTIYKCNFTNILIFDLYIYGSKILSIENFYINSVALITSRLITFHFSD